MRLSKRRLSKLSSKTFGKQVSTGKGEKTSDATQKLSNDLFVIEKGIPEPLRNISYNDQLRIIETLKQLNAGDSFPIKKELMYPVRKMTNMYFPEYKVRIMLTGDSYRVFRRA